MLEAGVLDTYLGKFWGIKLATNAAVTVLRVDQVSLHVIWVLITHSSKQQCKIQEYSGNVNVILENVVCLFLKVTKLFKSSSFGMLLLQQEHY